MHVSRLNSILTSSMPAHTLFQNHPLPWFSVISDWTVLKPIQTVIEISYRLVIYHISCSLCQDFVFLRCFLSMLHTFIDHFLHIFCHIKYAHCFTYSAVHIILYAYFIIRQSIGISNFWLHFINKGLVFSRPFLRTVLQGTSVNLYKTEYVFSTRMMQKLKSRPG